MYFMLIILILQAANPTYDPKEYASKNAVLRQLNVESQSVRKGFKLEERSRMLNIVDDLGNSFPVHTFIN